MSVAFKLHEGGNARRGTTPPLRQESADTDFNYRRDPIIAKAVKMADRYYNPDPLIQLIGLVNESTVILEGKEYPALLDSGAQPSGISLKLAKKLGLKIYQLDTLLDIEGFWGMMYLIWDMWRLNCKLKNFRDG